MVEQADIIKSIWNRHVRQVYQADIGKVNELPIKIILDFLVKERVAHDRDKAKNVVMQTLGENLMNDGMISFDEFNKLFCKGMFKQALIKVAKTF